MGSMGSTRCYDCGQEIDADDARRRDVVVSRETSSAGVYLGRGFGQLSSESDRVERVDLCPRCNLDRDRADEAWARADRRRTRNVLLAAGITLAIGGVLFLLIIVAIALK
jgi:hypothetical protein